MEISASQLPIQTGLPCHERLKVAGSEMFGFDAFRTLLPCFNRVCRKASITGIVVFLACIGCKHDMQMTPDAVYSGIEKEFISGNLSRAREHSEKAYLHFQSSRPDWTAAFRIELAKVLIYQGKSGDALSLLQPLLPARSSTESEVRRKIFLSIAQVRLGHLDEAEQTLLEAERECPEGALRAEVLSARGSIDLERGDLDEAERAFQASLAGVRLSGNQFLQTQTLLNLGIVALREEHYEDALMRFARASALARSIGAKLALEKAVGNLGWVYYKTGDFQRSLTNCKEAERQAAALGSPIDQVHWLNNAGLSEYRLGDINAARSFYEKSLELAQSIQNQEEMLDAHVNLGFLLLRSGNLKAAEVHVNEANRIAALRRNDRAGLEPMLLNALLLNAKNDNPSATRMLLDLEEHSHNVPSLRWEAESTLARTYLEDGRTVDAGRWFQRAIETFQRQRSSLTRVESTLPFLENGSDLYGAYTDYLVRQHRADEALNVVDESRAEALLDGLKLSPAKGENQGSQRTPRLNARAIAARTQATILVYSLRPKVSYLWAITAARQQFYELPGSETILPLIQSHTKSILASKDVLAQPGAPGRGLYEALVGPAERMIGKGGRVFIVGDEGLSSLNFETLLAGGETPHFWIEDVAITNAKSLRLLSVSGERESRYADRRILLMGDPVYRDEEYAKLANASAEVANIAGHFAADHRTVLTGAQASPDAYRSHQPGGFSYIHFVAHATANMTTPLDSAVVLSRNRDDSSAYKLYAREILSQNLHADLVTLSSCYGSGQRQYTGEGLVGLAWAFLRAGSHHVIGAMWEVSDVSTPQLMDHLYGELAKGNQPDAALRSAKLAMLHSSGVFRKPLYWAPFLLYSGA
jgi:CHAT domain-containing protein/tetratricopeptide (TPR) repeat protein